MKNIPTFTETLSAALVAIETGVREAGFSFKDAGQWERHWQFGGIAYETTKTGNFELETGKPRAKRFLTVSLYRTPAGRYEITAYIS